MPGLVAHRRKAQPLRVVRKKRILVEMACKDAFAERDAFKVAVPGSRSRVEIVLETASRPCLGARLDDERARLLLVGIGMRLEKPFRGLLKDKCERIKRRLCCAPHVLIPMHV